MKSLSEWDSAGWRFFSVSFVLCFVPLALWFPSVMIESDDTSAAVPYVFAAVIAVTVAGLFTVIVNTILQGRAERRLESEKAAKQSKKK